MITYLICCLYKFWYYFWSWINLWNSDVVLLLIPKIMLLPRTGLLKIGQLNNTIDMSHMTKCLKQVKPDEIRTRTWGPPMMSLIDSWHFVVDSKPSIVNDQRIHSVQLLLYQNSFIILRHNYTSRRDLIF